jgi:triacylglycerol lipase
VLLVHGTFTNGRENFSWNYELLLPERGFDYCLVTYPERGMGDMQVSAEYVAYAVDAMHERTGRKVDIVGHSQGGMMPRWAVKWWPSVQARVDDYVSLAGPHHGVALADDVENSPFGAPPVAWQFDPDSEFVAALNAGDETPGDVDYTSLYSLFDTLVQPVTPVPTAALEWGQDNPKVRNVLLQDVCPARLVDHLTIGTTDRVSMELTLDALSNPGPADPARLDLTPLCVLPDQYTVPEQFQAFADQFERTFGGGDPPAFWETTDREPELKSYVLAQQTSAGSGSAGEPSRPAPDPGTAANAGATLAATGGEGAPLAAGVLVLAAMLGLATTRRRLGRPTPSHPRSPG